MNIKQRRAINDLTKDILDTLDFDTPVDVVLLVKKLGGKVVKSDNVKASFIKKSKNGFEVYINKNCSAEQRNFLIACELGHLFLNMGFLMDAALWSSTFTPQQTLEDKFMVVEFAGSLLMPKKDYICLCNKYEINGRINMTKIASYFHVSRHIAIERGKALKLLK